MLMSLKLNFHFIVRRSLHRRSTGVSALRNFQSNQEKVGETTCYLHLTGAWGGDLISPS